MLFRSGSVTLELDDIATAKWQLTTTGYKLNFNNDNGGSFNSKMTIVNNGNVGIGSGTPAYTLDVAGSMRSTGTAYQNCAYIGNNINASATNAIANGININGTTNSISGPHVQAYTTQDSYPIFQQLNWQHDNICLGFDSYYTGSAFTSAYSTATSYQIYKLSGKLNFNYATATTAGNATTYNAAMTISGANVGIGTSSPAYALDVVGQVHSSSGFYSTNYFVGQPSGTQPSVAWSTSTIPYYGIGVGSDNSVNVAGYYGVNLVSYGNGSPISFFTNVSSGGTNSNLPKMTILSSGNVGIGLTNPATALDVNGGIHVSNGNIIRMEGTSSAVGSATISVGGYGQLSIDAPTVTGGRFVVTDAGNVGIGSSSPTFNLDVTGKVRTWDTPTGNTASFGISYHQETRLANSSTSYGIQAWGRGANYVMAVYAPNPSNGGWNGSTGSVLYVAKDAGTSRSISLAGTLNASGADYAEYMVKYSSNVSFNKGDIVGVNSSNLLTDQYSDAITFMVKSTDPCMVGGDVWGSVDIVGERPEVPPDDADDAQNAAYTIALSEWEAKSETARQMVDRIAFAGQCPVNVKNANAGDYIIPVAGSNNTILGQAVSDNDITFTQFKHAIGKVLKINDDGNAFIKVF